MHLDLIQRRSTNGKRSAQSGSLGDYGVANHFGDWENLLTSEPKGKPSQTLVNCLKMNTLVGMEMRRLSWRHHQDNTNGSVDGGCQKFWRNQVELFRFGFILKVLEWVRGINICFYRGLLCEYLCRTLTQWNNENTDASAEACSEGISSHAPTAVKQHGEEDWFFCKIYELYMQVLQG